MKSILALYHRLIPSYARKPLLAVVLMNFICYYVPKAFESHRTDLHMISTALDDALPRIPAFIFIYVLAYVQWVVAYIIITRDSREHCRRFVSGELSSKVIAMAILLIYPTTFARPALTVTDFPTWVMSLIYKSDTPTNLFPSMHCVASWFCFRGSLGLKKMPKWYPWVQGFFSLLVFASVVLVKQHVWPDILGGIAVAELGILLARLFHFERLVDKLSSARSHA
ncbi:MAG: phosphatase PAP2 family protein [Oscillospiraceae bacterium]|nr:phosphatase PAP2 family protein [Oscillospiraceae bacterium]